MPSYRDELAAAHARIAALEEQLANRSLRAPASDARIAELEEKRDKAARAASPRTARRVGIALGAMIAALFGAPALLAGAPGLGAIGAALGVFIGALVWWSQLGSGADILMKAQRELDDALRLRALEQQVAETRHLVERAQHAETTGLRVAAPADDASDGDDPEAERGRQRR